MNNRNIKKYNVYYSTNSENEIYSDNLTSDPALSNHFWKLLKKSLTLSKNNSEVLEKIHLAKQILRPVIEKIVTNAYVKVHENSTRSSPEYVSFHCEYPDGAWATNMIKEIDQDLRGTCNMFGTNAFSRTAVTSNTEHFDSDVLLMNEAALDKLKHIHRHLGVIVMQLQNSKKKNTTDSKTSYNFKNSSFVQSLNMNMVHKKSMSDSSLTTWKERANANSLHKSSYSINQSHDDCTINKYLYARHKFANDRTFDIKEELQTSSDIKPEDRGFSNVQQKSCGHHVARSRSIEVHIGSSNDMFEEVFNEAGDKQLVIKCLNDLEKVRCYLVRMAKNEQCSLPNFAGLYECDNRECKEKVPHLHSYLKTIPLVLKLNENPDLNELESDLLISIRRSRDSDPDIEILLNRCKRYKDCSSNDLDNSTAPSSRKRNTMEFRHNYNIQKHVKNEGNQKRTMRNKSMKITIDSKNKTCFKKSNFIIFDTKDPCNSVIRMNTSNKTSTNKFVSNISSECPNIHVKTEKYSELMILDLPKKIVIESQPLIQQYLNYDLHKNPSNIFNTTCSGKKKICSDIFTKFPFLHPNTISIPLRTLNKCLFSIIVILIFEQFVILSMGLQVNLKKAECTLYCQLRKLFSHGLPICFEHSKTMKTLEMSQPNNQDTTQFEENHNAKNKFKKYSKLYSENKQKLLFYSNLILDDFHSHTYREIRSYEVRFFEYRPRNKSPKKKWHDSKFDVNPNDPPYSSKYFNVYNWHMDFRVNRKSKYYNYPSSGNDSIHKPDRRDILLPPGYVMGYPKCKDQKYSHFKHDVKRKVSFREDVIADDDKETIESPVIEKSSDALQSNKLSSSQIIAKGKITDKKIADVECTYHRNNQRKDKNWIFFSSDSSNSDESEIENDVKENDSEVIIVKKFGIKSRQKSGDENNMKSSKTELEKVEDECKFYIRNSRGKAIHHFFNQHNEMLDSVYDAKQNILGGVKSVRAEDLAPLLFDVKGHFIKGKFDEEGKKIKAVYDSRSNLLNRINDVRFKNFSDQCSTVHTIDGKPIYKFYEADGSLLTNVYGEDGLEITVTATGNAKELVPFIFDQTGKLLRGVYNSKGNRLKGVYDHKKQLITRISCSGIDGNLKDVKQDISAIFESTIKRKKLKNNEIDFQSDKENSTGDEIYHHFYNQSGEMLDSIYDAGGNVLGGVESSNVEDLAPLLFDAEGRFIRGRFDKKGKKIKAVYDSNKKLLKKINLRSNVVLDESTGVYTVDGKVLHKLYDADGALLTNIYDAGGFEITVTPTGNAKDLVPFIYDETGKFRNGIYNSKRKRLKSVYDSKKQLITRIKPPNSVTNSHFQEEAGKGFYSGIGSSNGKEIRNFYNEKGEILDSIYDAKKNIVATTNSPKAIELTPFLFDADGRLKKGIFDKAGRQIETVFDSNNEEINGITYLNQSVAKRTSYEIVPTNDTNLSPVKLSSFPKENTEIKQSSFNFYDSKGELLTQIYDSEGHLLTTMSSDMMSKLFDEKGHFRKNYFDRNKELIKAVYDSNGKIVEQISAPKMFKIASSDSSKIYSIHSMDVGKSILNFFDLEGRLITAVFDDKGHALVRSPSGNANKLAPFLFDANGRFVTSRYDFLGYEIDAVCDSEARIVSQISIPQLQRTSNNKKSSSRIYSGEGRRLLRFYDSEGTLLISLHDCNKKLIASVPSNIDNAELLAKHLFDKYGNFVQGMFDFRGNQITGVYDAEGNFIRSITNVVPKSKKTRGKNTAAKVTFGEITSSDISDGDSMGKPKVKNEKMIRKYKRSRSSTSVKDIKKEYRRQKRRKIDPEEAIIPSTSISRLFDMNGELITRIFDANGHVVALTLSGKASALAPYLFDSNGKFVQGMYDAYGHALTHVFDSSGQLINKILVPILQQNRKDNNIHKMLFYDQNGKLISNIYNEVGSLICESKKSDNAEFARHLFNTEGKMNENIFDQKGLKIKSVYDSNGNIIEKLYSPVPVVLPRVKSIKSKSNQNLLPKHSGIKDKNLTIIYDPKPLTSGININTETPERTEKLDVAIKKQSFAKKKTKFPIKSHRTEIELFDVNGDQVNRVFDERGKQILKVYNSRKLAYPLHSENGALLRENLLTSMFDKYGRFRQKSFDSNGNLIRKIYTANNRLLSALYDANKRPAKVESGLIYIVSKSSLPKEYLQPTEARKLLTNNKKGGPSAVQQKNVMKKVATKKVAKKNVTGGRRYIQAFRQTRSDPAPSINKHQNVLQVGHVHNPDYMKTISAKSKLKYKEIVNKRCQLNISFGGAFSKRYFQKCRSVEEDSFEKLINKLVGEKSQKLATNSTICKTETKVYQESGVPINRDVVEKTLTGCVHLNSDSKTNVVGKVSHTVLQHFTTLILKQIKKKFNKKLTLLRKKQRKKKCASESFEDSLMEVPAKVNEDFQGTSIGTDPIHQDEVVEMNDCVQTSFVSYDHEFGELQQWYRVNALCNYSYQPITDVDVQTTNHMEPQSSIQDQNNRKAFLCNVPNAKPFIILMKDNAADIDQTNMNRQENVGKN